MVRDGARSGSGSWRAMHETIKSCHRSSAAEAAARRRLLKQKVSLVYEPLPSREFTRAFGHTRPLVLASESPTPPLPTPIHDVRFDGNDGSPQLIEQGPGPWMVLGISLRKAEQ